MPTSGTKANAPMTVMNGMHLGVPRNDEGAHQRVDVAHDQHAAHRERDRGEWASLGREVDRTRAPR